MRGALIYVVATLRRTWRSALLLALLVGLVGAVVLGALAGARRTASSFDRFKDETRAPDLTVFVPEIDQGDIPRLRALPGVEVLGVARQLTVLVDGEFGSFGGPLDDRIGHSVDRPRLLEGRRARQDRAREIVIPETLAEAEHVGVGGEITINAFTQEQVDALAEASAVPEPAGPEVVLRVVGVSRAPSDLSIEGAAGGPMFSTKAFVQRYSDEIGSFAPVVFRVRVTDQDAAVRFVRTARRLHAGTGEPGEFQVQPTSETEGAIQESIDVLSSGLFIFSAIAAVAGLVLVGIALRRSIDANSGDAPALRALGLSRPERVMAVGASSVVVAVVGSVLAVIGAVIASPLMPMGLARQAEPDLGIDVDLLVLGGGLAVVALVVILVGVGAASGAARAERVLVNEASPPLPVTALGGALPAPVAVGTNMLLERRRGRTAMPARQGMAAATIGVAGLVAVIVIGASLNRLDETPRAFGYNWDAHFPFCQGESSAEDRDPCTTAGRFVRDDPAVADVAGVHSDVVEVDGHPITAYDFKSLRGQITPTVIEGRAPRGTNEVALGTETLAAIDADIGDRVQIAGQEGNSVHRVVGIVVLPVFTEAGISGDLQAIADGAVVDDLFQGFIFDGASLVVRWKPGADLAAAKDRFAEYSKYLDVSTAVVPLEVQRLEQIDALPWVLGALLAVIGVFGVGYVMTVGVRRRARDLAVLKTMGFRRAQIVTTVATQATVLLVVGSIVGVPLGLVVGRFIWQRIASGVGVVATTLVPALALSGLVLLSLLIVNAIAFVPARRAARLQPATVLRSE